MDAFPDQDPLKLSFPKLHKMVCELPEFGDKPEASNEKILENIQMAWYSEQKEPFGRWSGPTRSSQRGLPVVGTVVGIVVGKIGRA
jgi:FeS assembly protein IscX